MPKLSSVQVRKLLGHFDHEFDFDPGWEFVILHGPNGVGKTKLLELIHVLSTDRVEQALVIPFRSASLSYDDGTELNVERLGSPDELSEGAAGLNVSLKLPDRRRRVEFSVDVEGAPMRDRRMAMLERHLPVERTGADEWVDLESGDHLNSVGLMERFNEARDYLPSPAMLEREGSSELYKEFAARSSTHLIETQRLLASREKRQRSGGRGSGGAGPSKRVLQYSRDLTEKLAQALAENSTTSQKLDRSFPRRVLSAEEPEVTDTQIRERYEQQGALRNRLAHSSLLDASEDELPLEDRRLEAWERRVLWTYLEDTEEKLATFTPLLDRVQLLQKIVNSRFLFKSMVIDRDRGFRFATEDGRELGAGGLSSGEQHELVLTYDLLFTVAEGSLVLIDEPEISLHVSWQQNFLADLQQIAELRSLRFIIATHSPQVIHNWWERATALYEEETVPREPDA